MGRRGRFVLQPRRISEIFVTSITLVTLALTGVAAAATPDRAPSQSAGTAGTSPAPDPRASAGPAVADPQVSPTGHRDSRLQGPGHNRPLRPGGLGAPPDRTGLERSGGGREVERC